jgi:signal peptidase I
MRRAAVAGVLLTGLATAGLAVLRGRYVSVTVDGPSMEPTLHSGDVVLVRRTPPARVRPASADSRTFGYVRGGQLLGVVVRVLPRIASWTSIGSGFSEA